MKTALQRITDLLEAGGINVSAIETWPEDDDGAVSVSLRIRPLKEADRGGKEDPVSDEPGNGGCHTCAGGPDCDCCPNSPGNGTPVKLYTPEEAAGAMLAGEVLKTKNDWRYYWRNRGEEGIGFWAETPDGNVVLLCNFIGLYSGGD